jgi:hypothetical protein
LLIPLRYSKASLFSSWIASIAISKALGSFALAALQNKCLTLLPNLCCMLSAICWQQWRWSAIGKTSRAAVAIPWILLEMKI